MSEQVIKREQNLILENRKKLLISGVSDVDSFNESNVFLFTSLGELRIRGRNLHINEMNIENGDLCVEGEISAMIYGDSNKTQKLGFFKKIIK